MVKVDFQSSGCSGFLFQLKAPSFFFMPLDLLAQCLWVFVDFSLQWLWGVAVVVRWFVAVVVGWVVAVGL